MKKLLIKQHTEERILYAAVMLMATSNIDNWAMYVKISNIMIITFL